MQEIDQFLSQTQVKADKDFAKEYLRCAEFAVHISSSSDRSGFGNTATFLFSSKTLSPDLADSGSHRLKATRTTSPQKAWCWAALSLSLLTLLQIGTQAPFYLCLAQSEATPSTKVCKWLFSEEKSDPGSHAIVTGAASRNPG